MCPPTHFAVRYAINQWMDPTRGADAAVAVAQWQTLHDTYRQLGHRVDLIDPDPDLADMVFAANGGLVVTGRMFGASFAHRQRRREAELHRRRFAAARDFTATPGADIGIPTHVNEGEGDFLVVGELILAASGFRTDPAAHGEVADFFGRLVVSLRLHDPRFYHLDTAVAVLDDHTIAYYPDAFTADSRRVLEELFPDAIIACADDALVLGLNAVSDGRNVLVPTGTTHLVPALRERGFHPIEIDLSELLKAGGSVKCATMELHR